MTDGADVLAAILANPDDDNVRLVYADWLEEYGAAPERAEFIRVQVALAQFGPLDAKRKIAGCNVRFHRAPGDEEEALRARVKGLWDIGTNGGGFLELPAGWGTPHWHRGFVEQTKLPAADWLAHGDAICAAHPVRKVKLTTWPVFESTDSVWTRGKRRYNANTRTVSATIAGKRVTTEPIFEGEPAEPHLLKARWPGVEFELQPASDPMFNAGFQAAMEWDQAVMNAFFGPLPPEPASASDFENITGQILADAITAQYQTSPFVISPPTE